MYENTLGVARKFGAKVGAKAAAAGAALALSAGSALAEIPAESKTALGGMKADGMEMAGIVLVAIIAVFAIKFLRKGL
ncbi:major capsid protein [Acidovorax sp. SUPP3434]|uniref:major capsid protein n=1 Tax=Acidovorax sp. SUPP3434 TaxID=2920880 RepID=UPI0023DE3CDB|nr:major capsid protein [Acidovorax sp. SUPP3434]GKT01395.1 major capsid protein [Acidovorax sp. SUPP3434]GKT02176.1 major capsid protein [Acidovorax sp. SUPP3434]